MAKKRKKKIESGIAPRADRRFADPSQAPTIVSEKRLTFFLPEERSRELSLITGYFRVENAKNSESKLPETPSALVREAVDLLVASLNGDTEEWESKLALMRGSIPD